MTLEGYERRQLRQEAELDHAADLARMLAEHACTPECTPNSCYRAYFKQWFPQPAPVSHAEWLAADWPPGCCPDWLAELI